MRGPPISRAVPTVIGSLILGSCCGDAGCVSGFTVLLDRLPDTAFRIEVTDRDRPQQPPLVFDCADPAQCGAGTRFEPATPRNVRVRLATAAGETVRDVRLDYDELRPNGTFCGPSCASAQVTVAVPR